MVKSFLVVPREKLLEKLQCSNGNGDPSSGSAVASSMEKEKEREGGALPPKCGRQ